MKSVDGISSNIPPLHFLALGDSYTIGSGVPPQERWPIHAARLIQQRGIPLADPVMIAKHGWTSGDLKQALTGEKPKVVYHLITLQIGVNDQYEGVSSPIYHKNLTWLLHTSVLWAGNHPERILVLSIPVWSVTPFAEGMDRSILAKEIENFNQINRQLAGEFGTHCVDVTSLSRKCAEDRSLLVEDGLHPSGDMYRSWAQRITLTALKALAFQE